MTKPRVCIHHILSKKDVRYHCVIHNLILSHPHLDEPSKPKGVEYSGNTPKYSANLVIPVSDNDIYNDIEILILDNFPSRKNPRTNKAYIYHEDKAFEEYYKSEYYKSEDLKCIRAKSLNMPFLYKGKTLNITNNVELIKKYFYPGCRVSAEIKFYQPKIGEKLCCELVSLAYTSPGDRIFDIINDPLIQNYLSDEPVIEPTELEGSGENNNDKNLDSFKHLTDDAFE